jgi:glycosyltransferase involved in cell wall biosynthesis
MRIGSVVCGVRNEYSAWIRIDSIAKSLTQKGHEVEMIHFVTGKYRGSDTSGERFIETSQICSPFVSYRALRDSHYDIVYGNTHQGALLSLPGRLSSKPVVFDMHGDIPSEYLLNMKALNEKPSLKHSLFLNLIDRLDLSFSNLVLCVSHSMIKDLASRGVRPEQIAYVPNGVDLEQIRGGGRNALREEHKKIADFDTVIGYAGRWNSWQGMPLLWDVIEKCEDRGILFILAGLDFKVKRENLICIPWLPRARMWELYDVCDAMVLPRSDSYVNRVAGPTKFTEYCAMGKPVISTPIGDPSDFITERKCGIVVDGFETDDLMAGIKRFATTNQDEVARMGANAYRLFVDEFRWPMIVDRLESRLLELTS